MKQHSQSPATESFAFTLPKYAPDGLEPILDRQTITYHHGQYYRRLTEDLNRLWAERQQGRLSSQKAARLAALRSDYLCHNLYFSSLEPPSQGIREPKGQLQEAVVRDFGSFPSFVAAFREQGMARREGGFLFLVSNRHGRLSLRITPAFFLPPRGSTPLLAVDLWEHAYLFRYPGGRDTYLQGILRILNWNMAECRYREVLCEPEESEKAPL